MNPIQKAVLDLTGITPEMEALQSRSEGLEQSLEEVDGQYRLLLRQIEDLDYLNLYDIQHITEVIPTGKRKDTINRLRRLRHENPLAKQSVKLITRFTLGKGIQWSTVHPQVREVFREFWSDEENQVVLTTHEAQKELLDETVVDGEKFLAAFVSPKASPYVKLAEIPVEEINSIIYDPDNRRVPVWYKRDFTSQKYDGNSDRYEPAGQPKTLYYLDHRITKEKLAEVSNKLVIPAGKQAKSDNGEHIRVIHIFVNPVWGKAGKRGISELYASREWLKVFREFMENRAAINAAATTIALKRKIKGGPAEVARFKDKLGDLDVGMDQGSELKKLTRPVAAAIYDQSPAMDLEWMKTDTGASQAKEDARLLLMVAGAGMATNIHYFGEGGDANLATAQAMELPMVKAYEDWQTWFKQAVLYTVVKFLFSIAFKNGIPSLDDERSDEAEKPEKKDFSAQRPEELIAWAFPPIISKDIVKIMTGFATLTTQIARDNSKARMAAIRGSMGALEIPNLDQLLPEIEAEEDKIIKEKAEQKKLQQQQFLAGGAPKPGTNGKPKEPGQEIGFQKAGALGTDADTARVAQGKPPLVRGRRKEDLDHEEDE